MRSLPWQRGKLIEEAKSKIWRYLSPASDIETHLLEASALLHLPPAKVHSLAALQLLSSAEMEAFLEKIPLLLRKLATTTITEEEFSPERIRGPIQWGRTFALRAATGISHSYVTSPARRAFQTPENELLVFLLDATVDLGRGTGWHASSARGIGSTIAERVDTAERWRHSRMLAQVERSPITGKKISQIRTGRRRRTYEESLRLFELYRRFISQLDRAAIRTAVETHGIVVSDDATLFELVCTFRILEILENGGWKLEPLHLFEGALQLAGRKDRQQLVLWYQGTPRTLRETSIYAQVARNHGIAPGGLRPDLVIAISSPTPGTRWILVEVKGGAKRSGSDNARAALLDLLGYRRAFKAALQDQVVYGLGVAWGEALEPNIESEVLLATPDSLPHALGSLMTKLRLPEEERGK